MSMNMRLIVRQGPQAGQAFELQQTVLSIGRSRDNDIQIDDTKISRRHASLTRAEGGYVLQDLGSTNGTFVNNRRITMPMPIQPGDIIAFGDSVVVDVQGLAPAPQAMYAQQPQTAYEPPPQAIYTPPPPPAPLAYEAEPRSNTTRNIAIGCGLLLAMLVCVVIAGFLLYQFAPAELAGPICDALRPIPLLGLPCQ